MQTTLETRFCIAVISGVMQGRLNEKQALASALNQLRVTDESARKRLVSEFYRRKRAGSRNPKRRKVADEKFVVTPAMRIGAYNADQKHRRDLGDDY